MVDMDHAVVRWERLVSIRARGMVLAKDTLFLAGVPDVLPKDDPYAALDGRRGALLWAVSTVDGATRSEMKLEFPPVFDGLIAANGKVYLSLTDGESAHVIIENRTHAEGLGEPSSCARAG